MMPRYSKRSNVPRRGTRLLLLPALLFFSGSSGLFAQLPEPPAPAASSARPSYKILRFNEDWSVLQDPKLRTDGLDVIKYIRLSPEDPQRYLSVGGEFRGTYENVRNDNLSQTPFPNYSFGMQRFQLFLDSHLAARFRVFLQLESGLEQGRAGGPRPIDAKRLDFLNAFADLRGSTSPRAPRIRIGRQELNFGSGRLVAVREGPNVRQGFYGFDLQEITKRWTIDGFAMRPAKDNPGYFDNVPLHTTQFWGVFASRTLGTVSGHSADLYYFGLDRKNATFQAGTGREVRQTIGARVVSPAPLKSGLPHYDVEAVYQFGHFGQRTIQAWTVSGEFGYVLNGVGLKPQIGLRTEISSGDGGNPQHALGTFNPLFPIGNYFGVISDTGRAP